MMPQTHLIGSLKKGLRRFSKVLTFIYERSPAAVGGSDVSYEKSLFVVAAVRGASHTSEPKARPL